MRPLLPEGRRQVRPGFEYWLEPPEPRPDWCEHDADECDGDCHPPQCRCADCDPDYQRDLRDNR